MYFFESSRAAHDSLTEAFDFAEPVQGALWNFRWQLLGYLQVCPNATETELHNRFLHGTSVRYRNLRGWPTKPWPHAEQQLARFLLINIFAIYESWIGATLKTLNLESKENERGLQFPSSDSKGYAWVLSKFSRSHVMQSCFGKPLSGARRYSAGHQANNLLVCYRAFKEFRNAIAHAGSLATQRTIDAYAPFAALTASDLGIKQVPATVPPSLNAPVELVLKGVVGLSSVLLRLLTTLDCELAQTIEAEGVFLSRWRTAFPGRPRLNDQKAGRHSRVSTMVHSMALPRPEALADLCGLLKAHGLVAFA